MVVVVVVVVVVCVVVVVMMVSGDVETSEVGDVPIDGVSLVAVVFDEVNTVVDSFVVSTSVVPDSNIVVCGSDVKTTEVV